jgi:hypothetical protein
MSTRDIIMYAVIAYGCVSIGYSSYRGYRRRSPFWTRASWWRFGVVYIASLTVIAGGVVFGEAVDWAADAGVITTKVGRGVWVLGALGLMAFGATLLAVALSWFSTGAPERPFPGVSNRQTNSNDADSVRS